MKIYNENQIKIFRHLADHGLDDGLSHELITVIECLQDGCDLPEMWRGRPYTVEFKEGIWVKK